MFIYLGEIDKQINLYYRTIWSAAKKNPPKKKEKVMLQMYPSISPFFIYLFYDTDILFSLQDETFIKKKKKTLMKTLIIIIVKAKKRNDV